MNNVPLISGALPVLVLILGGLSLLWLVWGGRRHLLVVLPVAAAAAVVLTFLLFVLAEGVLYWWDASLPRSLYIYAAAGILAVLLAAVRIRATPAAGTRALAVTAAVLSLVAVASAANSAYAQYPTLGSLLDPPRPESVPLPERAPETAAGHPATTEANWVPPADMPATGRLFPADIPGTLSGYAADPGLVYLPPAYLADPPALNLPVLVLIHGRPGGPADWLIGGELLQVLDEFAAAHSGLAPVVVIPDASNAGNANWPLCLDSDISASATYLAVDLPAWVRQHLASGLTGARQWAVAGYSYGGTCALTLAVNFPQAYPSFVDVAGEAEPALPQGRDALIERYFGGDASAFARQNPLDILAAGSFSDSAGVIVVGADDPVYAPQGRKVFDAARSAGMDVSLQTVPGGHSWQVWKAGLAENLDWLGRRLGILAP
ncbi:alpha/beta fold hydrolase [Arthrobacter sp. zg-ZUI100]|uniref:alpha/beta hydrolase n=1 Tax=Arthrobacter jiangjiafuii TaxID=2817475 RepID=UPI001AEED511|nr:alpha/beta fold hydrolase [Arthrobacter jiangjiafuii]